MKIFSLKKIFDIQLNEWLTFEYKSFGNQLKFTNMCKDMLPLRTDNFPPRMGIWTRLLKMLCYHIICDIMICLPGTPLNSMRSVTNLYEKCAYEAPRTWQNAVSLT